MRISLAVSVALLMATPALAADGENTEAWLTATAEKVTFQARKGPSLFRPGFVIGEYTGSFKAVASSTSATGVFNSGKAKASIDVERPGMTSVTAECKGGQSRLHFGWITFKRDKLSYVCRYGGAAPAGAEFALTQAKGGFLAQLSQPQRAAELAFGDITLRAETKYISGLPLSSGGANSYVISRPDGVVVGGLQTNGFRPVFWLPRQPGPERDAVALMAVTLFAFQDPGRPDR
ncbi:MAG: hypothetical protein Q8L66_14180 [Caulobacter sp.]|nr:hypothetical protein [Caulobacter sp.]